MLVLLGKTCRPLPCGEGKSAYNVASCDPVSFVSLLCLHLGVGTPLSDGVVEMSSVLAATVRADDFFFRSYTVDPIGVAQRVLALIDEISLGANAAFTWEALSGPYRITQLARIAREIEKWPAAVSQPTTLRRLIRAMNDPTTTMPLTQLILSEPTLSWPRLWRDLFAALEAKGTEICERQKIIPVAGESDLRRVTRKLLLERPAEQVAFADDKSIIRINGASTAEVADAVAAIVQYEQQGEQSLTIVRSGEAEALDAALVRQDLPALGCGRADRGCAPVEILPLMLDLMSGPADPTTFLAFLSVDPNPLPSGLRRWLIQELTEKSAVYPESACAIVDQYVAKIEDEKISERAAIWKEWLRVGTCGAESVITATLLEPMLQRIESWAEGAMMMPGSDDSIMRAFSALIRNVRSFRDAMTKVATEGLKRIQLQSLIAQVLSPARLTTPREQSSILVVDDPSMIPAATDTIIWWMAHDNVLPRAKRSIWTESERTTLANHGIELLSPEIAVEESYAAAQRLLALTTGRFILVTVDRIADDPASVHPLWFEIEHSFLENSRPKQLSLQSVWSWLASEGQKDLKGIEVALQTPFLSTWKIPQAPYAVRERESPSSLETMLGCPLAWTLKYRAGLYDGSSYGLADGFLLLGILAHACFEEFFKSGAWALPQEQAEIIAAEVFDRCLRMRAGILLTPGRDRERLEAQSKTIAGMLDLAATLLTGGWEFVAAEETVETSDLAQPVRGRLDLLFRRSKMPSEKLVVDVKYVGKRRRQQELQRGASIQLATYSRILRAGDAWPKTAYYIVVSKDLLTVHGDIAPDLYRIKGEDEGDVWSRVETAITTTTARLSQGLVDVGIEDENPSVLAEAGRVAPAPCKYCDYRLFCRTDRRSA